MHFPGPRALISSCLQYSGVNRESLVLVLALVLALLTAFSAFFLVTLQSKEPTGSLLLESVSEGLAFPVSLAMAPDGRFFYNELRDGGVRIIEDGLLLEEPFVSLEVVQQAETGLLGLALHPEFSVSPYVYLYYTYQAGDGIYNRISRFRDLGNAAGTEEIVLDRVPANSRHNGGRLAFGPDGKLYASVGDTLESEEARNPHSLAGKILRMNPDGSIPEDNPFEASYTYLLGVRNVFGMDFTPGGTLLFTENGPFGNDELNRGRPGADYGWPDVQGFAMDSSYEDPLLVFPASVAPTGLAFYTGGALGEEYANEAFFASWNDGALRRIIGDVEGGSGAFEAEIVVETEPGGMLDVMNGPDGYLYVSLRDRIARVIINPMASEGQSTPGTPAFLVSDQNSVLTKFSEVQLLYRAVISLVATSEPEGRLLASPLHKS